MKEIYQRILIDIKNRKNIELYLVLVVAFIVIILDTFGVDTTDAIFEVLLAITGLLAFSLIGNKHDNEILRKKIEGLNSKISAEKFFSEWSDTQFKSLIGEANEISMIAVANHVFLSQNAELIKNFVLKGGELRCILVDPSGNAMKMVCDLATGYEKQIEHLAMQVDLSIQQFKDFAKSSPNPEKIKLKLIDHMPYAITTMMDTKTDKGIIFVTLEGFEEPSQVRPSFTLKKFEDKKWFNFYLNSYENIWKSEKNKEINLLEPNKIKN